MRPPFFVSPCCCRSEVPPPILLLPEDARVARTPNTPSLVRLRVSIHEHSLLTHPDQEPRERPSLVPETALTGQDTSSGGPPPSTSASAEAWVGRSLGKYRITAKLGEGGMGFVLKAHDPLIDRDVAIKLLANHLSTDPTALARFLAEARAIGKLNHPNVSAIY